MSEVRLTCINPKSAAAVIKETALPRNRLHTLQQDGAMVIISYVDPRWAVRVAEQAHENAYATATEVARVIEDA